ncbi:unnamed protein product [Toxocara canis]|uniref:Ovule protein n=1 Tax=Toxocara canis TaxID=6265 RepID=A0A183U5L4_TOXCA|nr:unnamed protein product [Toxocara canis]
MVPVGHLSTHENAHPGKDSLPIIENNEVDDDEKLEDSPANEEPESVTGKDSKRLAFFRDFSTFFESLNKSLMLTGLTILEQGSIKKSRSEGGELIS